MSLLVFKSIHGLAPSSLNNEIIMEIELSTRNARNLQLNNVYVPSVDLQCVQNSCSYCGPMIWNSLPDDMKVYGSLNVLKSTARSYFFNKLYV